MSTAIREAAGALPPGERERSLYATMLRLRRFEEKAGMLYAMGTLQTPCPLGIGQEGALAALTSVLDPADIFLVLDARPTLELALGATPDVAFDCLLRRSEDCDAASAFLRLPGEPVRRMSRERALAAVAGRPDIAIVLDVDAQRLHACLDRLPKRTLAVLMTPSDRKSAEPAWPEPWSLRACDGADVAGVCAAAAAARADVASGAAVVLTILTPPYAGHARDLGRRAPSRRQMVDAVSGYRQALLAAGLLDEAEAAAIEAAARDEIAAAGRAIALSCAP